MSSLMSEIVSGVNVVPPGLIIAGPEKLGKSTFAASAPDVIFIPTENGLNQIGPARFPVAKSYNQVVEHLGKVIEMDHDFKWLAIDTLDCMQSLLFKDIAARYGKSDIAKIPYGDGYKDALGDFETFLEGLECVRERRNMGVMLICQVDTVAVNEPEKASYTRYDLRLYKTLAAKAREWADAILFAQRKTLISETGTGLKKRQIATGLGADGGDRVLRCVGSPGCAAGNRYGMPEYLPLQWSAVEPYLTGDLEGE